jgi:hypothetical protein
MCADVDVQACYIGESICNKSLGTKLGGI